MSGMDNTLTGKRVLGMGLMALLLFSVLSGISLGSAFGIYATGPSIALSRYTGPPGISVWVNGTGFNSDSTIYITWDSSLLTTTSSDANGNFSTQITIPQDTAGTHTVGATDTTNSASEDFIIVPAIYDNPSQGYVGTTVDVDGDGFSANVWVYIFWDTYSNYLGRVRTDSNGVFQSTFSFNVPESPYGIHSIIAIDENDNRATTTFLVLNNLVITPNSGGYNTVISFSCTGYSADTYIYIIWDMGTSYQQIIVFGRTDDNGSYEGSFLVPESPYGVHNVTGIDAYAHSDTELFRVYPKLYAYPGDGGVGDIIFILGYGYSANANVNVYWDYSSSIGNTYTNVNGTFSATFNIPYTSVGTHIIYVEDANGVNTSTTYSVYPRVVIHPDHGVAGISAYLNCTGFSSNTGIDVYWDYGTPYEQLIGSGTTDSTGSYNVTMTIPSSPNGTHSVVAIDDNNYLAQTTFYLGPTILLNPDKGYVGTNVTITGYSFSSNSIVNIYWDGVYLKSITANSTGDFVTYIVVPSSPYGSHEIKAIDADGNSATAPFDVVASLIVSSHSGHVFDNVTIYGYGFTANSAVYIYWDSINTHRSMLTNSNGEFTLSFQIPENVSGDHQIYAEDVNDVRSNSTYFNIIPSIYLEPDVGVVGSSYKVYCYGFSADSILTLLWDNTSQPYTVVSSNVGSGVINAVVPVDNVGVHNVIVYDTNLNIAGPDTFVVKAVDAPAAIEPAVFVNTSSPTLTWTAVDYAAEYELQYDTNASFTSPVTVSHIKGTSYTLAGLLDSVTYYWRVRAIDSAGNPSNYSNVLSFTVDISQPSSMAFVNGTYANNKEITIHFNATDSVSGVSKVALYYSYDGGDYIYYGEIHAAKGVFDFNATHGDGTYYFYTIAYDNAGNIESKPSSYDCYVVLDTVAPKAYVEPLPEYVNVSVFNITFVAWDNGTGVRYVDIYYTTDLSTWTYYGRFTSSPVRFVAPYDATYYFQAIATDYAGNVEKFGSPETHTVVDTSAPGAQISVSGVTGKNGWFVSDVIIGFIADGGAEVYYSINNSAWVRYQASFVLGDGVYSISYYAVDAAGNRGTIHNTVVKVDTLAPHLSILSPRDGDILNGTVVLQVNSSDDMSDVSVEFRIDNGNWMPMNLLSMWKASVDTSKFKDGAHIITIRSEDAAGNYAILKVMVVTDNSPPSLINVSMPTGVIRGDIDVKVKATDYVGVSQVYCVIMSGNRTIANYTLAYNTATGYFEHSLNASDIKDGEYTIIVYAIDKSGHVSTVSSIFTVDNTAPTLSYSGPRIMYGSGSLKFTVDDTTTKVVNVWVSVDGGEWKSADINGNMATYWLNVDIGDNGVHLIKVKAVDEAGNVITQEYTIYVDVPNFAPIIIYTVILVAILITVIYLLKRGVKNKGEYVPEHSESKDKEELFLPEGGDEE